MRKRMTTPPCLQLLLGLAACTGAPPAAPTLRVMAYNVKHGQGMDGRVDLERVARVIEARVESTRESRISFRFAKLYRQLTERPARLMTTSAFSSSRFHGP